MQLFWKWTVPCQGSYLSKDRSSSEVVEDDLGALHGWSCEGDEFLQLWVKIFLIRTSLFLVPDDGVIPAFANKHCHSWFVKPKFETPSGLCQLLSNDLFGKNVGSVNMRIHLLGHCQLLWVPYFCLCLRWLMLVQNLSTVQLLCLPWCSQVKGWLIFKLTPCISGLVHGSVFLDLILEVFHKQLEPFKKN